MNLDIIKNKKKILLIICSICFFLILTVFFFLNNGYAILKNEYNEYFIADVSAVDNRSDLKYSKVMPCKGLNKMKALTSLEVIGCSDFEFLNNMPKLKLYDLQVDGEAFSLIPKSDF